ncbi:MAG: hypothetical protein A2722_00865 [Candidatus Doudnabacteria bacterium RIFCSPHIGHO2_01_FULL_50_11]|uniref:Uncharacterized protein n=1 Tax=Candidatus Doudnabacteria bacterium RIFCSPHIGHO2_01_FULL_50_11 TaxID=1817828 RepID=A0A1F5PEU6_9BACT|nr:MAG: hypothetical protein A2722_00865 [Candidatus Doudnabacteria bacterium RIFCSPHIGHO2_01_FULL_50_11]HLC44577.1 hypothetical protein [Patescibacteria group bacterium]
MTIYDDSGVPIASSGHLDGALPRLPQGVLDYARAHGENRVTWQPLTGVRVAAVVTRYSGQASGFVLAGRSLREVEAREGQLAMFSLAAWAGSLVLTLIFSWVLSLRKT